MDDKMTVSDEQIALSAVRGMAVGVPVATLRRAYTIWQNGSLVESDLPDELRSLYSNNGISSKFVVAFRQVCYERFSGLHLDPVFVMGIIRSALTSVPPPELRLISLTFAVGNITKAEVAGNRTMYSVLEALSPIVDGVYVRIIPECRELFQRTVNERLRL